MHCRGDCCLLRVTEAIDVTNKDSIQLVESACKSLGNRLFVWISSPCTSGCTWHRTNPRYLQSDVHVKKLAHHERIARTCWNLVQFCIGFGCRWAWEWPRHNDMWKGRTGASVREADGAASVGIDECALGLCIGADKIRKPWMVVSNDMNIISVLRGYKCDGRHTHLECRGAVASNSGLYTNMFASLVHSAIANNVDICSNGLVLSVSESVKAGCSYPPPERNEFPQVVWQASANALRNSWAAREHESSEDSSPCLGLDEATREVSQDVGQRLLPLSTTRTNIFQDVGGRVRGMHFGLQLGRGKGMSSNDRKWPLVLSALHSVGRTRGVLSEYCSVQLNMLRAGEEIRDHVDTRNSGDSWICSWGEYSGGVLEIMEGNTWEPAALSGGWAVIHEGMHHRVTRVRKGVRMSAVFYRPLGFEDACSAEVMKVLREHGFPVSRDETPESSKGTSSLPCDEALDSGNIGLSCVVIAAGNDSNSQEDPSVEGGYGDETPGSGESQCSVTAESCFSACPEVDHHETSGPNLKSEYPMTECHRALNLAPSCPPSLFAGVVRQIMPSSPEWREKPCQDALMKEVETLRQRGTWDEDDVVELHVLRRTGKEAMIGRVFAILGEKHAEENRPEKDRVFKGRCVFQGNQVSTITGVPAEMLYQQLGSSPATMSTARTVMGVGRSQGFSVKMRDVSQAYLQSLIDTPGRTPTYVILPREFWPEKWFDKDGAPRFKCPVCRLKRALYGHPEAGKVWEDHLSEILKSTGWYQCPGVASTWLRKFPGHDVKASLVVYVDDLLLATPPEVEARVWAELEKKLDFKDPPEDVSRYLGAVHESWADGNAMRMRVDMKAMLEACLVKFRDGMDGSLRSVRSPYVEDNVWAGDGDGKPARYGKDASSYVASLLFIARMARPDLITAVTRLARFVTKWERCHDLALERLFGYIQGSLDVCLEFALSRSEPVEVCVWADADLNGDPSDTKSTSGMWCELRSKNSKLCWPISWISKRQGCTAFSTCESEVVSLSHALREEGIPVMQIVSEILGQKVDLTCYEDNSQAIQAVKRGYSKKLRHLPRIHRICLGSLHELLHGDARIGTLQYHPSIDHKADLFTKSMECARFEQCCSMLGLRDRRKRERQIEGGEESCRGKWSSTNALLALTEGCGCMDRSCD
eukprot:2759140-Amphidinium_carterae.1